MYRRSLIWLALPLTFVLTRESAFAQRGEPSAPGVVSALEVAPVGREPALERSDQDYLPFAGVPIRRIQVKSLAVFGASVDDTSRTERAGVLRLLNHLNFQTREITIRRSLLFDVGDAIDPVRLADSERILRNLAFLGDARILVGQEVGCDSADVRVIVKDAWTLALSIIPKDGNRLKLSLDEKNVLGWGHRVSGAITLDPGARPGFTTSYAVPNARGSFINGKLEFADLPNRKSGGLGFSRELLSPVLRYAGGLDLTRTAVAVPDSLPYSADNTSNLVDLWAGRLFPFGSRRPADDRRLAFFLSGRIRSVSFTRRPPVTPSTFHQYHNIRHSLGSLSIFRSRYYRTGLLYDVGRTEDIPYGFLARLSGGVADEEFARKPYLSGTLAAGDKFDRLGYGVFELRAGGNPQAGVIRDVVLHLRSLYFSNLLPVGDFQLRQFISAEYTTGMHRSGDDSIDFVGEEGIRGVVYDGTVTGTSRLLLNLETVTFSPWRVRGVSFAFFSFADLDVIAARGRALSAPAYYSGLGLGVRLHKTAYGFGPVQLRFAWYPRLPIDHDVISYTAFEEKRFRTIGFLGSKPEIVEY